MRLLIVSDTYTPDINGVARTLRNWAGGMCKRGHTVDMVTTSHSDDPDDPVRRHVVMSLPLPGYRSIRVGLASISWFTSFIQAAQPDIIYVATETPMGIAAIWAAKRGGLPTVSGFHTNFHTYLQNYHLTPFQTVAESFLAALHNQTSLTLAPSAHTAEQLRQLGISDVAVVGRGVDPLLFKPEARDLELRRTWGCDDSTPVAIHVGRLAEEKNLALLESAFAAFHQMHPQGRCVVVGDGPSGERLRNAHQDWIFAGMRSGADLARHYASGDVFVFPSLSETFGNVVTEAMASGLAVIAYDYAAAGEHILDGPNGFTAPINDSEAFIQKAKTAFLHWDDGALRQRARQTALKLGWDQIVETFESHLQAVLTRSRTEQTQPP